MFNKKYHQRWRQHCSIRNIQEHGSYRNIQEHLKTSGNILEHLETSRNIQEHLGTSRNVQEHLGTSRNFQEHLGTSGNIWEILGTSKNIEEHRGTTWYNPGPSCINLDHLSFIQNSQEHSSQFVRSIIFISIHLRTQGHLDHCYEIWLTL